MRAVGLALAIGLTVLTASRVVAEEQLLTLRPEATKVSFTLDATAHTVEGVLSLRSGAIRFDTATGAASGDLIVDLHDAKTGNAKRDKNMHEDVLETTRFPLAVFHAKRVTGTVAPSGRSDVGVEGVMTFHGADHPMTLTAVVTLHGEHVVAETSFPIPFVEWGLHDPSFFVLRVAKIVSIKVRAEGELRRESGKA